MGATGSQSVLWRDRTAEDLRDLARRDGLVVLPVGSIEQHGPHLPVGVDTILCETVCRQAAEKVAHAHPVIVAPTLWCGMAEHHMAFGGTFTFDIPTYRGVLLALLASIGRAGFRKVAIVNGHGGNIAAINSFLPDIARDLNLTVRATTYFQLADATALATLLDRQTSVRHACEVETSLMLHLAPQLVRTERMPEAHGPAASDTRPSSQQAWARFASFSELSPSGVMGDARTASAEKGVAILDLCVAGLAASLADDSLWQESAG